MALFPQVDQHFCRKTLEVAQRSREKGNLPFGCILVDAHGTVLLDGENTVITSKDPIAHCEINLMHGCAGKYAFEFLNSCTVYASTNPVQCAVRPCSGAALED